LKNFFERMKVFPNIIFAHKSMQACLQKKLFYKIVLFYKGCLFKTMFENEYQNNYFIKVLCSYFKRINFQTLFIFWIMQAKPFAKFIKSSWNLVLILEN
jgi:hypothetical protein